MVAGETFSALGPVLLLFKGLTADALVPSLTPIRRTELAVAQHIWPFHLWDQFRQYRLTVVAADNKISRALSFLFFPRAANAALPVSFPRLGTGVALDEGTILEQDWGQ